MARRELPNYKLINVWFNDKEKLEYDSYANSRTRAIEDLILDIIEAGAKVSFTAQDEGETYLTSISIKPTKKIKVGKVLMYRHSDLTKSFSIAHYHFTEVSNYGTDLEDPESDVDW